PRRDAAAADEPAGPRGEHAQPDRRRLGEREADDRARAAGTEARRREREAREPRPHARPRAGLRLDAADARDLLRRLEPDPERVARAGREVARPRARRERERRVGAVAGEPAEV